LGFPCLSLALLLSFCFHVFQILDYVSDLVQWNCVWIGPCLRQTFTCADSEISIDGEFVRFQGSVVNVNLEERLDDKQISYCLYRLSFNGPLVSCFYRFAPAALKLAHGQIQNILWFYESHLPSLSLESATVSITAKFSVRNENKLAWVIRRTTTLKSYGKK
jgi:hypothetical protein